MVCGIVTTRVTGERDEDVLCLYQQQVQEFQAELVIFCRQYCGRKLRRLYKAMKFTHGRGKYIAFLDGDDLFLPKKLERHVAYLEKHPECDVSYDEILFFRDEIPGKFFSVSIEHLSGFLKEDFIRMGGHCVGPSSAVFKRELFEKYGGGPEECRNIN